MENGIWWKMGLFHRDRESWTVMQPYGNVLVWGRISLATQFTPGDQASRHNEATIVFISTAYHSLLRAVFPTSGTLNFVSQMNNESGEYFPLFPLCDSHNFNFSSKKNFRLFQILCFDKQLWSQVTAFRTLFLLFKHKNFIYSSHVKHHGSCVKF